MLFYICGDHHVVFVLLIKYIELIDFFNVKLTLRSLNKSHLVYSPLLLLLLIQRKVNTFSCSVGCLFTLLIVSFDAQNLLNCDEVQLVNIFLHCLWFWYHIHENSIYLLIYEYWVYFLGYFSFLPIDLETKTTANFSTSYKA